MKVPSKGRIAHHTRKNRLRKAAKRLRALVATVPEPAPPAPVPEHLLKPGRR